MTVRVWPGGRVRCRAMVRLPLTARQAWGQLRDFHRYASHDHFHAGIAIDGGVPRGGAGLRIEHRYGPLRVRRVGRILWWRESDGFAFSDLPVQGRGGFPHVLSMRVVDDRPGSCRLTLAVGGLWTARTPRWLARLWLAWVFVSIVQRTRNDLLRFARSRCGGREI